MARLTLAAGLLALLAGACTSLLDLDGYEYGHTAVGGSSSGGAGGAAGAGGSGCVTPDECPGVDDECGSRTCTDGACGREYAPSRTSCIAGLCDGNGNCVDCLVPEDCAQAYYTCIANECVPTECANGVIDGNETDVDCGGGACPPCGNDLACAQPSDCASAFCDYFPGAGGAGGGTAGAAGHAGHGGLGGLGGVGGQAGNAGSGAAAGSAGAAGFTGSGGLGGAGGSAGNGGGGGGHPLVGVCAACGGDDDCLGAGNSYCSAGTCLDKKEEASECSRPGECSSGFCPADDGICCDAACDRTCEACLEAKSGVASGTCGSVPSLDDPDNECPVSGAQNCGSTGVGCNGDPAAPDCVMYDNSTVCAPVQCVGSQLLATSYCDGSGMCVPGAATPCAPYACNSNGQSCLGTCGQHADCTSTNYCDFASGDCIPKLAQGLGCTGGFQCQSGYCTGGFCCNAPCGGSCQTCSASGQEGSCLLLNKGSTGTPGCAPYVCDGQGVACPTTCADDSFCTSTNYCSGNSCVAKSSTGGACTATNQCLSGYCVDGVCCADECLGTCRACTLAKTGSLDGTCAYVVTNSDPDGECSGSQVCNGAGSCKKSNGDSCSLGSECLSNNCVDNVCCNEDCSGTCRACASAKTAGTNGVCAAVTVNTDPDNECLGTEVCDGAAACKKVNGDGCLAGTECLTGQCVNGVCCNGACTGACDACNLVGQEGYCSTVPKGTVGDPTCTPYVCGGTLAACPTSCADDSFCAAGNYCSGTTCVAKQTTGSSCTAGNQCLNGLCVDGFCCNEDCLGGCRACSLAKTGSPNGTCANVTVNTDPDAECLGSQVCDGAAACKKVNGDGCSLGTECLSNRCVDGFCCNEDCLGSCRACSLAKTGSPNGTCANVTVNTDPDAECLGTQVCDGAAACKKVNGDSCLAGTECLYTLCVDGVCCNSSCVGDCAACDLPGTEGVCTTFTAGSAGDPSCAPYECNGVSAACPTSCIDDSNCVTGTYCDGSNVCATTGQPGAPCTANNQCLSNRCVDSVCCQSDCAGLCEACTAAKKGSGSDGSCGFVAWSTDPDNECAGTPRCDGAGACKKLDGESCGGPTDCLSNHCFDGVCCNVDCSGTCEACTAAKKGSGSDGTCGVVAAYYNPDNECLSGLLCDGAGACKEPDGSGCSAGTECVSTQCVDNVCCENACAAECRACSAAKKGSGFDGDCGYIAADTDPDGECLGPLLCNGSGVCKKVLGDTCGGPTECVSGNCVDGVCCDDACGGECQACTAAKTGGTDGICAAIPAYDNPDGECAVGQSCDGAGACRDGDGQPCGAGTECISDFCIDGVCCQSDCAGICEACSVALKGWGVDGECGPIPAYTVDGTCGLDESCDGFGFCKLDDGISCGAGGDCVSDECVDGVCCEDDCVTSCMACSAAKTGGSNGLCRYVTATTDPDTDCPLGTEACDGYGICREVNGAGCSVHDDCISAHCSPGDNVCCNTACSGNCEACVATKTPSADGVCNYVDYYTDPDGECVGVELLCNGAGACKKANGTACVSYTECLSNNCVDGVCCNSACNGLCQHCRAQYTPQADGTCGYIDASTDPFSECVGSHNCNGFGGCD